VQREATFGQLGLQLFLDAAEDGADEVLGSGRIRA
jgi:hypothetical protein